MGLWQHDQPSQFLSFSTESFVSQETFSPKQAGWLDNLLCWPVHVFSKLQALTSRSPEVFPPSWVPTGQIKGSTLLSLPHATLPRALGTAFRCLSQWLTQLEPPLGRPPANTVYRHTVDTCSALDFQAWFVIFKARLLELENPVLTHKV